jgi:Tol biopolymer transport system component
MRGRRIVLGVVCTAAVLLLPAAGAAPGVTTRASVAAGGGEGNGGSFVPAISADSHYVAFYSDATNLVANDNNLARDVFVFNRDSRATERVSVASGGAEGNSDSFAPAISSDGRYVAFSSAASNLVAGDGNGANDIFVRDRQAGTTTRVSLAPGGADANGSSFTPSISADGRYVAFTSDATNLVAGDNNYVRDVYVVDRGTGAVVRASVSTDGTQANLDSFTPVISGDGRYVAFTTYAANLVPVDENEASDVFVHDLVGGTTIRVSEYTGGFEAEGDQLRPSISYDGRYVAFDSDAWNLVWGDLNEVRDIFVNDRETGVTTRVSVDDSGAEVNGENIRPSISADGRYIAFSSEASNLVSGDTNGAADDFVYDWQTGAVRRVSIADGGTESNADSIRPVISANGVIVAFESDATNLVSGDRNGFTDVFLNDRSRTAAPKAIRCVVPRVIGLKIAAARAKIGKRNCLVGRIKRVRAKGRAGRVLAQNPKAGSKRPRGFKVKLTVGRN